MREQEYGFLAVVDRAIGEIWLVEQNQGDGVHAGNVFRSDDDKLVPRQTFIE